MLQCTSDQFTTYSNYGSCPCGPVIICAGCSTGCCCPTNGQPAPTTYPPAPPPYPPYSGAAHLALLPTIITVVFLLCSS
ncbi:hypothetical protein Q1695_005688 [Nippostrongylus brasiliensis]|nr:hypothetical protein Q1695_005688 [Nippostrongylus brasiliensis]